ncbi:restriction endonuclease subunit S [Acinetobacter indicus]|uniref:Restriction endonuclease subunit S n=1 Tax=Acinetobacter indicus TaxID=756892 RepID=A0AAW8YZS7_9GAMM|nr:restriction endonuclease subunit S [Acinetobacter indicus]MDV4314168.1 restriction endonuclease subunit S [Acinetobacter indicus]MDV4314385.1 restriction endonuclease subunit S [Acinetobacter indicus]
MVAPKLRFKEFDGDWSPYVLKDFVSFRKGKGISKADISENGINECIRYGELYTTYGQVIDHIHSKTNVSKSECILSKAGDVIIPASGETQIDIATASCVLHDDIILSGDLNILSHEENGSWLAYYLSSAKKLEIAQLAQGNSVVHLYSSQLKDLKINKPSKEEQTKIASFLSNVDEKISQLTQKHELLSQYKQGMMQKLFSQQLRFKADDGSEFGEWEEKPLNHYLYTSKLKNKDLKFSKQEVLSVSGELGVVNQIELLGRSYAGVSVAPYSVVEHADIVYTKSPLKSNPYGIIKVNKGKAGIVSTLYAVYKCKDNIYPELIDYYFQSDLKLNHFLKPLVKKGAKNDMKVNNDHVLTGIVSFPSSLEEQTKIANFLSAIDQKIEVVAQQIEQAKTWKKGLLQQMFV